MLSPKARAAGTGKRNRSSPAKARRVRIRIVDVTVDMDDTAASVTDPLKAFLSQHRDQPYSGRMLLELLGTMLREDHRERPAMRVLVETEPLDDPATEANTAAGTRHAHAAADQSLPSRADDIEGALDAARARGRGRVADILNGDDMLTADAFAGRLGISRMTVNVWRRDHRVLGLEGARRGHRFPAWQVGEDGKPFPALPGLFARLGGPWAVHRFLVQHHPALDGATGREALRQGRTAEALEAADGIGRDFG